MKNIYLAFVMVFVMGNNAFSQELVKGVCIKHQCRLHVVDGGGRGRLFSKGEEFVIEYIFSDSLQVRSQDGVSGVIEEKGGVSVLGDFSKNDAESESRIKEYTDGVLEMKKEFASIPPGMNDKFAVMSNVWGGVVSAEKGELLKKETIEIDECSGGPVSVSFYQNGIIDYSGGLNSDSFLVKDFGKLENGLSYGLTKSEVIALLGFPMREGKNMLTYAEEQHSEIAGLSGEKYAESMRLFFIEGKLIGVWLHQIGLC